jgi:7-cyano-7-deazaguanine reductase
LSVKSRKPKGLTLLGRSETAVPTAPSAAILETFHNPAARPYWIRFQSADFTSLCPITGQADFAKIAIDYQPGACCLETKSLKFYLASYRNERAFNEAVTNQILDDLVRACDPQRMIIRAEFASRGGISLTITAAYPNESESTPR